MLITLACVQGLSIQRVSTSSSVPSSLGLAAPVSTVSVCTAELCCCQEDGMGGLEILADLKARKLPYPIDEAPCLGACGGGAMVAIDFDNGTSSLVTGLDETLMELGLFSVMENLPIVPPNVVKTSLPLSRVEGTGISTDDKVEEKESSEPDIVVTSENPVLTAGGKKAVTSSTKSLVDVRERMRTEALKDEERENPWLKAASYLAGKATERMFGGEK